MSRISVVVPVYNAEEFLESCVRSVLEQSLDDWELILVDDGSTDNSAKMCDDFAASDKRIRVIHQPNAGVSEARNCGIEAAASPLLAFLDSDDRYKPDFLKKMAEAMDGVDGAVCAHFLKWPDGRQEAESAPLSPGLHTGESIKNGLVRPLLRDRVEGERPPNGFIWRFCYRTEIVRGNSIRFSGSYLEDEMFLIEYFSLASSLRVIEEPLYIYLQNPKSVTRRYLKDFVPTFLRSFEMKKELVKKYSITGIEGWEYHTCWAGLLIATANIFAPGREAGFSRKRRELIELLRVPEFKAAAEKLAPKNVKGGKKIVVKLLRARLFTLLSLLYTLKNSAGA
ncbi:MAG: glycosyltransferase family 2 protein [Oscillospiraceae bacterium]|jgi:glycosyltransferase EpsJ